MGVCAGMCTDTRMRACRRNRAARAHAGMRAHAYSVTSGPRNAADQREQLWWHLFGIARLYLGSISALSRLYLGSISASPTACPLRGCGRAGTQNDRLSPRHPHTEAAILSTGTAMPAQAVGDAEVEPICFR